MNNMDTRVQIVCIFYNYKNELAVTSHPWARVVSPNQDPYEVPTPKHWRIIQHMHDPHKELSHEFLSYKRNA
jgi:hypothetical protein